MLVVAIAALFVNGISAWLLHGAIHHGHDHGHGHGHGHDHGHGHGHGGDAKEGAKKRPRGHELNLRGAWLHLLGDTLGSVAALVASIAIRAGGPPAIDPLASLVVVVILVLGAIRLLRDAVAVLVEAAPKHLPVPQVTAVLRSIPEVREVHDLHVWTLGAGHDAITAHVRAERPDPDLGRRIAERLRKDFEAEYVTVQVDPSDESCTAPPSRTPASER
jgi:cation diffusion facilitator family transporter